MNPVEKDPAAAPVSAEAWAFPAFERALEALIRRLQADGMPGSNADGAGANEVSAWAQRVTRALADGHVCVDLADYCAGDAAVERAIGALLSSPLVGADASGRPLVLSSGRLYLERYWVYETRLAEQLKARAADAVELDAARAASALQRWCGADSGLNEAQRRAAATVFSRRLAVITGGPGTGKTTTVSRVLRALREYYGEGFAVALTAPTGKAAARLTQSLRSGPAGLPGLEAVTLHRLLGMQGSLIRRRHREGLLPLDCLVVDETSMLDLSLAAALMNALPAASRLVLLGDRDQLSSVEAGAVMSSICRRHPSGAPLHAAAPRHGLTVDAAAARDAAPLDSCIAPLHASYRFQSAGGIGRLAEAVRDGDVEGASTALRSSSELRWDSRDSFTALIEQACEGYAPFFDGVRAGWPAGKVLAALDSFRVICALRKGPSGVERLNAAIERRLRPGTAKDTEWYPGRIIMVTANDYSLRLYNGDLGVAIPDPSGQLRLCFAAEEGGIRQLSPSRLPAHEPAFAMTIHKSQGSEFDRVLVVLPPAPSPVVSRELLYTAVTRARHSVVLRSRPATLECAVRSPQKRTSGLAERLWGRDTLSA